MDNLRNLSVKAFKWNFVGGLVTYGGSFLFSIVLARLLSPEEFGILGITMIFVGVSKGLLDVGFSSAIIQRQEVTEKQLSTVFYINIFLSIILFGFFYLIAPYIADFYELPIVKKITRLMSLLFVLDGISQVQKSILTKELKYDLLSKISVISVIISGVLAVGFSYKEKGVYALVIQQLSLSFFTSLLIWIYAKWRPKLVFSFSAVRELFTYGINLFFSSILHSAYSRLDAFIIGKAFTSTTLGLYSRSLSFKGIIDRLSSNSLQVLFPIFAKKQDDLPSLRQLFLSVFDVVSAVTIYLSALLWLIATPLFLFLLGQEWIVAADYFKIIIITAFSVPIGLVMMTVIKSVGKSREYLRLELYKKFIQLPTFLILVFSSIETFLWIRAITIVGAVLLNFYYISNILSISFKILVRRIFFHSITVMIPLIISVYLVQYWNWELDTFADILARTFLFLLFSVPLFLISHKSTIRIVVNLISNK